MSGSSDIVIVWGEVLWDRLPSGDRLGGAPANVAWHLGMAGGWAALVSRVGDDADGRRAIEQLAEHVDTSLVQIDPERATGEVTVRLEGGEPRYTLHPGARGSGSRARTPCGRRSPRPACSSTARSRSARPRGSPAGGRPRAPPGRGALRVYDLNLRPTELAAEAIAEAIALADVVKINDRELAALRDLFGWADPIAELRRPVGGRARVVAVTHGAAGSTLHGDGAPIELAGAPAAPGGDNIGCGDAYLAILVHGMTLGWDLAASGRAATRWAAAVAGARGATPSFDEELIAELLEEGER